MAKIKSLILAKWEKVPKKIREVIKEVVRWAVSTIYAIIWGMALTGELDMTNFDFTIRVIIFRFADRVLYLVFKDSTKEAIRNWSRRLLLVQ